MRRRAALLLAGLAPLTSGCIAAVLPVAAGAALVKRHADLEKGAAKPEPAAASSARSDLKIVATSLNALPPPDVPVGPGHTAISTFRDYGLAQAKLAPAAGKRTSAILHSASDLRVARTACGNLPPAVFLDLDPGRGAFDPLAPGKADVALGAALAELREQGVRMVWFSRLGTSFGPAVRESLASSGLDPAGTDELVLMRDIGERKQSLRDEFARRVCPIAMLGDERADFDELYLYLINPDAAVGLDAMLDKGWFLASPFSPPNQAAQTGATP